LPPLRFGNFLICLGPGAAGAGAGAAPIVNKDPPDDVEGARGIGAPNGGDGCCACWPNANPVELVDWGRAKLAPAGEAGCELKPNKAFADGTGAPKAKGEGWLKAEGLFGVEPVRPCSNGFAFCGVPKENEEEAVAEFGVVLKEKEPVVVGLCVSSRAFVGWPKENPVDMEGTMLVFPNVPNALGSSVLSLGAKRFDGDEPPKENGEVRGNDEVVFRGPPPNDVPVEEVLNENPLPIITEGLLAPLDC